MNARTMRQENRKQAAQLEGGGHSKTLKEISEQTTLQRWQAVNNKENRKYSGEERRIMTYTTQREETGNVKQKRKST